MADRYKVKLTEIFLERLDAIEVFLTEAGAAFAYDDLLADLRKTVLPNLRCFPRMGRRYLDMLHAMPPSGEILRVIKQLPPDAADCLYLYVTIGYVILYAESKADATVYLLSVRHHRQLAFEFSGLM